MPDVEIRTLKTLQEFQACERIQASVWGHFAASTELLNVTQRYGGVVLGALVGRKVVGFIYAFLARYHGRLIHWSHMMAVAAKHRNHGLGFGMKLFHRELALEQGIKYICWTFDPLQSRNAALNISRLGGRVEEYLPDCYGRFPSRIERGLPSDRVVVNWRISSSQVARRLKYGPPRLANVTLPHVNATHRNNRGFLENQRMDLNLDAFRLLVEIPPDTDAMRAHALPLARRWRLESRTIFTNYFQAGYAVRDFFPPSALTGGRCFYLLDREGKAPLELDADCK